jgi:GntR family transcriptional regulator/MocR family aminotransferase
MSMPRGRCINLGSFSKSLLPGLRLGYAVAPAEISRRLGALKLLTDSHSSLLVQAAVGEFLARGHFETHLRKLRRECRLRLEAFTNELKSSHVPLTWTEPDAGTNLWGALADSLNATSFAEHALRQGLLLSPGAAYFSSPERGRSHLLLSFAAIPVSRARSTVTTLQRALTGFVEESRSTPQLACQPASFQVEAR